MVDEVDLQELRGGSTDLARRDFRNAELSGLALSNRDFSGAHLEGANLAGSDLSNSILTDAKTNGLNAEGANLANVRAQQTVVFAVNLKRANLCGSDFSRSHFTRSNLTGADLRGANFKNAVFNEGTTFEACIVDEETKFDGASIFRPLARQEAFRLYRVERGILVRKTGEETTRAQPDPTIGIHVPKPSHFSGPSGEVTFDFSNNDGRAIFGDPGSAFETHWTRAGRDSIHAYVNLPSVTGIAIAKGATTFEEITSERLSELDFSSRSRSPRRGQILVARNREGQFAVFKIKSVTSSSHGDSRDEMTVEYRVLGHSGDATTPVEIFASQSDTRSEIAGRIDELFSGLVELAPSDSSETPHAGMGHNNPPEDTPIDRNEYDDLITVLQDVRAEIQHNYLAKKSVQKAASFLETKTKKILTWAGRKLEIAADEFAKEIGKSLGSRTALVTAWLALSGLMGQVAELLTALVPSLLH